MVTFRFTLNSFFLLYSATYWSSLSKTKVLDISDETPPHAEMLAITNEPIPAEYEDMSAMSYHM